MAQPRNIKSHEACSGCGVCLLVCPVWRRTGSMSATRKGRARAMQGGATPENISASIDACLMCGSCEPACPEEISILAMNIEHRRRLNLSRNTYPSWYPKHRETSAVNDEPLRRSAIVLAGERLCSNSEITGRVIGLLGGDRKAGLAPDDGRDIAVALEAGLPLNDLRIKSLVAKLRHAETLVIAEGILHLLLRKWVPGKKIKSLGEALLDSVSIRKSLSPDDIYIIESRAYHADFDRLVKYYDRLRRETGCQMNLDLQRIAIPTGASSLQARHNLEAAGCLEHARWIMKGRKVNRIVVEDVADLKVFQSISDMPVVHVSGL